MIWLWLSLYSFPENWDHLLFLIYKIHVYVWRNLDGRVSHINAITYWNSSAKKPSDLIMCDTKRLHSGDLYCFLCFLKKPTKASKCWWWSSTYQNQMETLLIFFLTNWFALIIFQFDVIMSEDQESNWLWQGQVLRQRGKRSTWQTIGIEVYKDEIKCYRDKVNYSYRYVLFKSK